ncbi:MAG: glutamate cyclase domain-containing protein [Phycisphaerae bacterium]
MIPRISSIENLIATDPGGRNIFGLAVADQLRLAAQSLQLGRRVGIVSGFYIPSCNAGETDGPSGAKVVGQALASLGIDVDYITDEWNAPLFDAIGLTPVTSYASYLADARPTHLLSIERAGRNDTGRYMNMHGDDITDFTAPIDTLFLEGARLGLSTIGIGDGGNEIGMGRVFAETLQTVPHGKQIATIVPTDFCIAAGVSNWGAYGLAGALSVLSGRDLLPSAKEIVEDIERMVARGGAVDGVSGTSTPTVDGLALSHTIRMIEEIRHQFRPSPLDTGTSLDIGILGFGHSGRASAALLSHHGHRVRVSDHDAVTVPAPTQLHGIETGGHTIQFLESCDLVVASPGVRADAPIRTALHERGIPVMSELEVAFQLCDQKLIAVTGTVGKRTTVELMQSLFQKVGVPVTIGGNRGRPLSELIMEGDSNSVLAIAVSSFQLETVVGFRPDIAVLLNIDAAHLDRHFSLADYERTKSRIFMNQRPNDILILPFDNERLRSLARKRQGRTLFMSGQQPMDRGAWLVGDDLILNLDGQEEHLGKVKGQFVENILATVISAAAVGADLDRIRDAVASVPF